MFLSGVGSCLYVNILLKMASCKHLFAKNLSSSLHVYTVCFSHVYDVTDLIVLHGPVALI